MEYLLIADFGMVKFALDGISYWTRIKRSVTPVINIKKMCKENELANFIYHRLCELENEGIKSTSNLFIKNLITEFKANSRRVLSVEKRVCKSLGLEVSKIKVKCRKREYVDARFIIWRILLLENVHISINYLARRYNMNRASILNGLKKVAYYLENNRPFREKFELVTN